MGVLTPQLAAVERVETFRVLLLDSGAQPPLLGRPQLSRDADVPRIETAKGIVRGSVRLCRGGGGGGEGQQRPEEAHDCLSKQQNS